MIYTTTVLRMKEVATKGWSLPVQTALRLDVGPGPYNSEDRLEGARIYTETPTGVQRSLKPDRSDHS